MQMIQPLQTVNGGVVSAGKVAQGIAAMYTDEACKVVATVTFMALLKAVGHLLLVLMLLHLLLLHGLLLHVLKPFGRGRHTNNSGWDNGG